LETLRVLGLRGAHVLAAARTEAKARGALDEANTDGTPIPCDLSDPASVQSAVQRVHDTGRTLDGIIANAGIMALPQLQTRHGVELQLLTNHVGHFSLVTGVLDRLADDARVVMLSSAMHKAAPPEGIQLDNLSGEQGYSAWRAYGQSKLANLLFAKQLAKRLPHPDQTANAVHPGAIRTNLLRHMSSAADAGYAVIAPLFAKTVAQGAATQCWVAVHPDAADITGEYFADCNVAKASAKADDPELARRLWERTEQIAAALPT
jgi:WW domain-containing oxidoreductase